MRRGTVRSLASPLDGCRSGQARRQAHQRLGTPKAPDLGHWLPIRREYSTCRLRGSALARHASPQTEQTPSGRRSHRHKGQRPSRTSQRLRSGGGKSPVMIPFRAEDYGAGGSMTCYVGRRRLQSISGFPMPRSQCRAARSCDGRRDRGVGACCVLAQKAHRSSASRMGSGPSPIGVRH